MKLDLPLFKTSEKRKLEKSLTKDQFFGVSY